MIYKMVFWYHGEQIKNWKKLLLRKKAGSPNAK